MALIMWHPCQNRPGLGTCDMLEVVLTTIDGNISVGDAQQVLGIREGLAPGDRLLTHGDNQAAAKRMLISKAWVDIAIAPSLGLLPVCHGGSLCSN